MKPFPMPPGWSSNRNPQNISPQYKAATPEPTQEKITDDETLFILKAHLRADDFQDPIALRFIVSYLDSRSTSQAAAEVGWTSAKGRYFRQRPEVHAAVEAITLKAVMKFGYDVGDVVERVKEISEVDPIELQNPDGSWKNSFTNMSPQLRRAIKKMKVKNIYEKDVNGIRSNTSGEIIEIEFYDKMEAHRLLAREKGTFKETKKIEHDVTRDMRDVLLESSTRAEERRIANSTPVIEIEGKHEPK